MLKLFFNDLIKKPFWQIFLISWLFYLIGLFLFSHFVWDIRTYEYNYTGDDFNDFMEGVRRIDLGRYLLSPLWVLFLSVCIWGAIKTGLIFTKIELQSKTLLKIVLIGMILLSLPYWVKSVWLILIKGSYSPDDIKNFYAGTLVALTDIKTISKGEIKILSHFNLSKLAFLLFVPWMIQVKSDVNYWRALSLCTFTYGLGFFLFQALLYVMIL